MGLVTNQVIEAQQNTIRRLIHEEFKTDYEVCEDCLNIEDYSS